MFVKGDPPSGKSGEKLSFTATPTVEPTNLWCEGIGTPLKPDLSELSFKV